MKPSDLLKTLQSLKLTRAEFAELVGKSDRTVRRWLSGTSPIPIWVDRLLTK